MCVVYNSNDQIIRGPNTALISFSEQIKPKKDFTGKANWLYKQVKTIYENSTFDSCINCIISLESFSIFKKRPNSETTFDNLANYEAFSHTNETEYYFGIQFLLTGILAAYYHQSRKSESRPGYTSFPPERKRDIDFPKFKVSSLR